MTTTNISFEEQMKLAQKEMEDSKEFILQSLENLSDAQQKLEEAKRHYAQAQLQVEEANKRLHHAISRVSDIELNSPGQWNTMFKKFLEFKNRYGHCNVSQDSFSTRTRIKDFQTIEEKERKSLARWVGNQRVAYKKFLGGQNSCLNQKRIDALNKLGFIWDLKNAKWYVKYHELVQFHKLNGHCRIPQIYNPELWKWVTAQRYSWKRKRDGKGPPHLSAEREALLKKVAFNFEDE